MSFFALTVFGLGAMSVATDSDIIAVPGLGQSPGIAGMLAAIAAFVTTLRGALRRRHPSFLSAPVTALMTALVHLIGVWFAVLVSTGDLVIATAVTGGLVQGGPSLVILVAAAIAAWGGIALRRTRAEHPRWPWERDEDE
ncbi:MAG: hypothetical protein WAK00_00615 [Microbacterium sp.]|uniref:hypothetical protein n=1 Tax=Microbacterium sp. TaxID=51671 RepID=UPI003BB1CA7A